jgi:thioredoxin 1
MMEELRGGLEDDCRKVESVCERQRFGVDVTRERARMSVTPEKKKYPAIESAAQDIEAALNEARRTHKRLILNFGADWCPDCWVLHYYFDERPNAKLVEKHFVVVSVNVGFKDANLEIARRYGISGTAVPALSVVESDGTVVYAQQDEFSAIRNLKSSVVTEFLNKWKT